MPSPGTESSYPHPPQSLKHSVREKSAAVIPSLVKRSVADMGPHGRSALTTASSTRTGCSWISAMAMEFVASLRHRTRHSRMDPSRAPYRELSRLDTRCDLEFCSCTRTSAWKRSGVVPTRKERASGWSLWASECYNRVATLVNDEWLSPPEIFFGSRPRLPLLPFLHPAYHRVPQQRKTTPRPRMCYSLNFGYNLGRDCYRLLDAKTGRVAYSRDVTWPYPETSWITPIRAAPTEPPRDIYVPMPQSLPVAAPSPALVATPPAPAPAATLPPPPTPTSNSPAPMPPRVSRQLEYEG